MDGMGRGEGRATRGLLAATSMRHEPWIDIFLYVVADKGSRPRGREAACVSVRVSACDGCAAAFALGKIKCD